MRIFIVRHGETVNNRKKRLQGRSDAPLNDNGRHQAGLARDFFAIHGIYFDRVYSSPLQRAAQTAEILAGKSSKIILEPRLLEMDYGPYEGCALDNPPEEIVRFFQDFVHNPAPRGMEDLSQVKARLGSFLEEITHECWNSILITTHAIAMKGALEYLDPEANGSYWSKYIGNCAVYQIDTDGSHHSVPKEIFSLGYEPGV